MLPTTKVVLGGALVVIGLATILAYVGVLLLMAGAGLVVVGLTERDKPQWQGPGLFRRAPGHPPGAERPLGQAPSPHKHKPQGLATHPPSPFHNPHTPPPPQ